MKRLLLFLLLSAQAQGALLGINRGTGTHNTSATTFTLSAATDFTRIRGAWAVLVVASDNSCSGGAACATFAVSDTLGNTWTQRQHPINDPSNAGAGVEGAIFTTPMNGGVLKTTTTITVTFTSAQTAKAWTLIEVYSSLDGAISYVSGAIGTAGTGTTFPIINTTSIANGDMVVAGVFVEAGTTDTVTGAAFNTRGTWSTQQTAKIGTTAAGMEVASQFKTVTAAGTQTYDPQLALTGADSALAWISLTETLPTVQRGKPRPSTFLIGF